MATPVATAAPDKHPSAKFEDFDVEEVFKKATPHAINLNSQNFVVEFGPERARIAFDLDADDFEGLLGSTRDTKDYPIRWMYAIGCEPPKLILWCMYADWYIPQATSGTPVLSGKPWQLSATSMNSPKG
jgi:hypothetical protein